MFHHVLFFFWPGRRHFVWTLLFTKPLPFTPCQYETENSDVKISSVGNLWEEKVWCQVCGQYWERKKKRYYFHNPHKSFPAVLSSEGNSFDLLINVETAALPISPELLIWPPINRPRAALSDLLFLLEFFFHILKLCAASQTLSKKKKNKWMLPLWSPGRLPCTPAARPESPWRPSARCRPAPTPLARRLWAGHLWQTYRRTNQE